MRRCFAPALLSLLLAATMAVINGRSIQQSPRSADDELSITSFGSLAELKVANLKGPLVEGYAIAYRVGNDKTVRSAYAVGKQVAHDKLLPDQKGPSNNKAVVRTKDDALEIRHEYAWEKQARKLIITRRFKNLSLSPVTFVEIDNYIDARLIFRREEQDARQLQQLLQAIGCSIINRDSDCDECPPCPCVYPMPCRPNDLLLKFLKPDSKLLTINEGGNAIPALSGDRGLIATYRISGVNLTNDRLMPGEQRKITIEYDKIK